MAELATTPLTEALAVPGKMDRRDAKKKVKQNLTEALMTKFAETPERIRGWARSWKSWKRRSSASAS